MDCWLLGFLAFVKFQVSLKWHLFIYQKKAICYHITIFFILHNLLHTP